MTRPQTTLPPITEAEFQTQVITYARLRGWKVLTFRKVRVQRKNGEVYYETPFGADGVGFPDLMLVRGTRILFAELKVGDNKPTEGQLEWLGRLQLVNHVEVYCWRETDWGVIDATLM